MSTIETRVDVADEASAERRLKFILTLVVATAIVAAAVAVLSAPLLGAGSNGPSHRAVVATLHAHT